METLLCNVIIAKCVYKFIHKKCDFWKGLRKLETHNIEEEIMKSSFCYNAVTSLQTLWRCYSVEKPGGGASTWKMYFLTPEAVHPVDSDGSSPNIRKLNITVTMPKDPPIFPISLGL